MRPKLTQETEFFWRCGADGVLRIAGCPTCDVYLHPPAPVCWKCLQASVVPRPVSGRGVVYSWTVSHYQWTPALEPPYVVALVELEEQVGLRLTTNIVGCEPADVWIGLPVQVRFVEAGDLHVPVFEPVAP